MERILHQLVGRLSQYLQGFIHPRWCRISSINSIFLQNLNHLFPNINDTIPTNNATENPRQVSLEIVLSNVTFWSFWWFLVSTISPKQSTKRLLQQASLSPSMIVLRQPTCPPPRSPRQQQHRWHRYCLRHRWSSTSQGWTSWLVIRQEPTGGFL